ncbi:uncharacterized protein LOC124360496 [Homalodisca vitripennis]|uniref:uncharacterized protein LOC124360496 n=1 Tax=Homalodisca vitripennis TaxID=197043 RepID=UPI001EEB80FD|nr:uncharacterized protein LOC124360496 [Homalodisca vitripennis]XP_046670131.1 uncharacterized protein LOC124360496 [Homalodisca vitripennis]
MGKVPKGHKVKDIPIKKSPHKKHGIGKCVPKVSFKRLLMLQRRLNSLLNEQHLWEEKNKELLDNLKTEKMLTASLRKESFHWQRLYHESTVKVNMYKVKQADMTQGMSACLREIDSIYPHMVAFSESVTSNKIRISNMLNSLPSSEYEYLPRQTTKINEDSNKSTEKPTKHRVGPMVRGLLITKPKIMLERLMLPQPQDHPEPAINDDVSTIQVNNQLTPIPEENDEEENVRLEHVSIRPKRKLGRSSWRQRRQEKIDQDRERERKNKQPAAVTYDGDSSDTESNPTALNDMEPVVRFKDVSRLLQNSSLLKVDSGRNGDTDTGLGSDRQSETSTLHVPVNKVKRNNEDPLEGSSWMFNNNHNHRTSYGPATLRGRSSLYKSDTSDDDDYEEENLVVVEKNITNLTLDSLEIKNKTFTVRSPKVNSGRFSAETSDDTVNRSPPAEPDSTNNVDVQHSNNSFTDLSENEKSLTLLQCGSDSSNTSAGTIHMLKNQSEQRVSSKVDKVSADSPSPQVRLSVSSLTASKRHSSFCNNCGPSPSLPEILGKRIRKQKTHLYPGEEVSNLESKSTSNRSSIGRKSKKKSLSTKIKKRSSGGKDQNVKVDDNGGSATKTDKKKKQSGKSAARETMSKKSSLKVENASRTSSLNRTLLDTDNGDTSRPRRTKSQINYREPLVNMKQRRP